MKTIELKNNKGDILVAHVCTDNSNKNTIEHSLLHNIKSNRVYKGGANLSGANLSGTDLSKVNLTGANLTGVKLNGTKLDKCTGLIYSQIIVTEFPTLTGVVINGRTCFYIGDFCGNYSKIKKHINKTCFYIGDFCSNYSKGNNLITNLAKNKDILLNALEYMKTDLHSRKQKK